MTTTQSIACVLLTALALGAAADSSILPAGKLKAKPAVTPTVQPFELTDVRLLDGPFKRAMELNGKYILSLDPDQLLHTFRLNAGLASTAKPLGGWEEPKGELRGHFVGHYLSACALMYASTGDARYKEKGDAIVKGLAEVQAKLGSGYLSAYPETFFDRVEARQRVWAPYYTLHKIYAGLIDMYILCDNKQALDTVCKFADWVIARNAKLTDAQMQNMLGEEHGGMNETLANLYAVTGEAKYLAIAKRFNHLAVITPATQKQDKLTGLHANTQIPKFVGTAREYELTGDESLHTASLFFWDTVVHERSYVIGGHSDGEHFSPKEKLSQAFGPSTTETCNTYNMLKLTRHIFAWDPKVETADYYERALYNHILASQNPEDGMTCYYVPLRPGSHKTYSTPLSSFWCCTGTGVENHAKYGDSIYFHDDQTLYVNLFIASELAWKAKGVKLRQETSYPDVPSTKLTLTCDAPAKFTVKLRHPTWAQKGVQAKVNGEVQAITAKPGEWVALNRTWKTGDTIELTVPFTLRKEGFRDNANRFALLDGPIVLSAQVDTKKPMPAIVSADTELLADIKPAADKPLTFTGPAGQFRVPGAPGGVALEPFFRMHGGRSYTVYFDSFTPELWDKKQEAYKAQQAREKELEARTVDSVRPGEEQHERDHAVKSSKSGAGDFGDRKYRDARDSGWFSWELKVQPDQPQELWVTYWGSDGNRSFDVLIDGVKLTTQKLANNKPNEFYDEKTAIPAEMLKGKSKITVKFQSPPAGWAGGVFGIRVMRP